MAGQKVDFKRSLSEIEVSFDTYFDKYVTPHIKEAKKCWDADVKKASLYNGRHQVHGEDLWDGIIMRLNNDHKFSNDFGFMIKSYRDILITKLGKDEYARLSHQCSKGDLAIQYMTERLHARTWEQLGKLNVDKSKVNYFVTNVYDKLIGNLYASFFGTKTNDDALLEKETRYYTDIGLRTASDSTAIALDLVTSPGKIWKLVTLDSTIQEIKEEYADKDNSLPVDRLIGPAVAGSAVGMQNLRSEAKTYNYRGNSHLENFNSCLTRPVYHYFNNETVKNMSSDMERSAGGDLQTMSMYGLKVLSHIDEINSIQSSFAEGLKPKAGDVPEWILKKSDDELRKEACRYATAAADMKAKGEKSRQMDKGEAYLLYHDILHRLEWYDMALAMRGITNNDKDYTSQMHRVGLITYGHSVPGWIHQKSDKQLSKDIAYYSSIYTELEVKGIKKVDISGSGKPISLFELRQRLYDCCFEANLRTLDRQRKAEEAERLAAAKEKEAQCAAKKAEYGTASADDAVAEYERAGAANMERRAQTEQRVQSMSDTSKTWESVVDHSGLNGISGLGDNLGYTLAMLPDMIMGMLTGQNKNLTLHKGALPLLMVFGSLFCHNPIMKYLLLGLGGLGFLGQSNKELQGREGTSRTLSTYKRYPDEPTDGRIVFNGIKGQDIAVTIDGNPFVVQLDPFTIDSYNRGAVSQGALCNAVLKAYDEQYSGVSERYERVVNQQEQEQLDQTLALK